MKNKSLIFLVLGLGFASATLIIDNFIEVPDWLAIVLMVLAIVFMGAYIIMMRKANKKK